MCGRRAWTTPLRLLAEHGDEARILAGGQSLMPTLNMRLSQPKRADRHQPLDALKGIHDGDGTVRIGALARHVEVMNSPIVARHLPLIAEAMPHVAHVAVRNRGTFGGSIALADPAAELPACILALGATLVVESVRGRRTIRGGGILPWPVRDRARAGRDAGRGADPRAEADARLGVHGAEPPAWRFRASPAWPAGTLRARNAGRHPARLFRQRRKAHAGNAHAMAAINGKTWSRHPGEAACEALADDLEPIANTFGSAADQAASAARAHAARARGGA